MKAKSAILKSPASSAEIAADLPPRTLMRRQRTSLSRKEALLVEDLAWRYGDSPESYFVTEPHSEVLFWNDHQAVIPLHVDRRCWHVPGGILAPQEAKPALIRDLFEEAQRQKVTLTVFSVNDEDAPLYRETGFQVTKFGEEPYVPLRNLNWSGKAFEWIRRQRNYCLRQGLTVREITSEMGGGLREPPRAESMESPQPGEYQRLGEILTEIQYEDLSGRAYEQPLRLMEGQLCLEHMYRRRVFIVGRKLSPQIEAFCIANPMQEGRGWAIEMYRKRKHSPRGTVPFLIREVIDQLAREGAEKVSLCLIPGRGLDGPSSGECRWARFLLKLWHRLSPRAFNLAGQEYFKTRFRPQFQNRFMAVTPRASLESTCSFFRSTGALDISLWKFLKCSWQRPHH